MNLLNFLHSLNIQLYQSTLSLVLCSSTHSVLVLLFSNVRYHKADRLCCEHKLRLSLQKKKKCLKSCIYKKVESLFSPRSRYMQLLGMHYLPLLLCNISYNINLGCVLMSHSFSSAAWTLSASKWSSWCCYRTHKWRWFCCQTGCSCITWRCACSRCRKKRTV